MSLRIFQSYDREQCWRLRNWRAPGLEYSNLQMLRTAKRALLHGSGADLRMLISYSDRFTAQQALFPTDPGPIPSAVGKSLKTGKSLESAIWAETRQKADFQSNILVVPPIG